MARPPIKARKQKGVALNIDNAPPLGTPRAAAGLGEGGQDGEAKDYPPQKSRPGGKKNKTSPGIVTKGKGIV